MTQTKEGIILKSIGGFYYVEASDTVYECKARGSFRKKGIKPVAGDKVQITVPDSGYCALEEVYPRKNSIIRPPLANIDTLVIVVSTCDPTPNTFVIDKMTACAVQKGIEPVIVISKSDLSTADKLKEIYNSGVGKSTLLNALFPKLNLSTGEISEKLGRGRHTTRSVELFKTEGGYAADTPGFSTVDLERYEVIDKDDLKFAFPEFEEYLDKCRFSTCSHTCEKGCSVVEALQKGKISPSRHQSYVAMYNEVKDLKKWEQ